MGPWCVIFLCAVFAPREHGLASVPSKGNATTSESLSAMDFMKKYGYLEGGTADSDALYKESAITEAVKTLQKFGNIPVTGQLDNATLELMAAPRCGVVDILRKKEDQQDQQTVGKETTGVNEYSRVGSVTDAEERMK